MIRRRRGQENVPVPDLIAEYAAWVRSRCGSMCEGCMCFDEPDHDGLHGCGHEGCPSSWTDEQATAWAESLR